MGYKKRQKFPFPLTMMHFRKLRNRKTVNSILIVKTYSRKTNFEKKYILLTNITPHQSLNKTKNTETVKSSKYFSLTENLLLSIMTPTLRLGHNFVLKIIQQENICTLLIQRSNTACTSFTTLLIFLTATISRTDEGQPRPKCIFNKCGTNIYFFTLQRFTTL